MNKLFPLFIALMFAASHTAYAEKKQTNISGAQTETHVCGTATPQDNKDGKIHASGAATPTGNKAAPAKNTVQITPQKPSTVTHQFNDDHSAPGEVRKPRQPSQAVVEQPRSPGLPRAPELPRNK